MDTTILNPYPLRKDQKIKKPPPVLRGTLEGSIKTIVSPLLHFPLDLEGSNTVLSCFILYNDCGAYFPP